MKTYKKSDLRVQTYGSGRHKMFIAFTDYEVVDKIGRRWHTRVYPDIEGNKSKATKQALQWLNRTEELVPSPWVVRNSPVKLPFQYNQYGYPEYSYETDFDGTPFDFYKIN